MVKKIKIFQISKSKKFKDTNLIKTTKNLNKMDFQYLYNNLIG